jgi:hypothetical protein
LRRTTIRASSFTACAKPHPGATNSTRSRTARSRTWASSTAWTCPTTASPP